jgi:hypothetical protein
MKKNETMKFGKRFWMWTICSLLCIFAGCGKDEVAEKIVGNQEVVDNQNEIPIENNEHPSNLGVNCEYRPFVVEGKEWTSQEMTGKDGYDKYFIATYLISGDAVVNGDSCKKLWRKEEGGEYHFFRYLLERDRKVYSLYEDNRWLVYDFEMTVGSTISSHEYSATLESVDTLMRDGELYRRFYVNLRYDNDREGWHYSGKNVWIEGIGSLCGPLMSFEWHSYGTKTCSLNGEIIFTSEDFTLPAWRDDIK